MDAVIRILFLSDLVVDWLQSKLQLPWEDINSYLADLLPKDGMAFPYMVGRLAYWGIAAGLLLSVFMTIREKKRARFRLRELGADLPTGLLAALSAWGLYSAARDVFFRGEHSVIRNRYITGIPRMISQAFHGEDTVNSIVGALLGIVIVILLIILFGVFSLMPVVYSDGLKKRYGKLTFLALIRNVGVMSSALSLVFLGLYYVIVNGGAVFAIKAWVAMLIISVGVPFACLLVLSGAELIVMFLLSFFGGKD